MIRSIFTGAAALVVTSVLAVDAGAGVLPPDLNFTLQVNQSTPVPFFPTPVQTGPDSWNWQGSYAGEGWTLQSDIDGGTETGDGPGAQFVNAFMAVQNLSNTTNVYTITVNLPISTITDPVFMDGSVGGAVTDSNGDGGATAGTIAGSAVYWGLLNGAPAPGAALLPFPYSATAGNGGTASIGPAQFGPTPGPGGVSMIGIQLQITLTPGDTAVLSSFFRVEPVPAPAGLALLGMAGLMGSRRRRGE